ncbi:DUF968 domain-containing protein [Escherichia coli]|nr:DUF968 domain-containing protein [Escherichia coli]
MRVLLRPVLVPELGLVVVKPGRESMPVFHNTRVLVEPEPKSMRNLPSGVVPAVRQPLVEDKTLLPFFSNARVIRAAGGAGALSDWLLRHIKSCQWPHGDYHHSETVIHRYGTGAMVLCWHCDNQLRDQTSESLEQLAHQNLSAWMIDVIRHAMNGTQERELSLAELSWWAVCNQVADALPEAALRRSLGLKIIAEPPDKRRRDLDNILKAPLDALTHAGLLIDDEQFDEINIVRGQRVPGGRLGVKIYKIESE